MDTISWDEFKNVDIRAGTIIEVNDFPEARDPAYILQVDFGDELGIKKSSAQVTDLYGKDELVGKQVIAVVNFPPKQIGPIMSECLVAGFHRNNGDVALAVPDLEVPDGTKIA